MKHKKTKIDSHTKNSSTILKNKNKPNSKQNYLKGIPNILDIKEKNDTENKNLKKLTNFKNCTVNLKDIMKNKEKPVEKTSKKFDNEQNKPKEKPILKVRNQLISAENQFETKKSKEIKIVGSNQKQRTQNIEKKFSKLPDNNEGELTENEFFNTTAGFKKPKTTTNENSNETVLSKKKSNSKGHHDRHKCIVRAVYQKCINNVSTNSNCRHKRKLNDVKEMINDFHKRLKTL